MPTETPRNPDEVAAAVLVMTALGLEALTDDKLFALYNALTAGWFPNRDHIYYDTAESLGWVRDGRAVHEDVVGALERLVPREVSKRLGRGE